MAIDVKKINPIKSDIADTSKDVEDLTKSINKLISSTKSLSTDTLQNSKDLVSIYGQLFVSVRSISDENKKSKIVEDAVNNINKQREEILNRVNELKQKGIILDKEAVEDKKEELKIENELIDKKLEMLNNQKAATGTWDADKLKFLEQEIRQLEIKKQYNDVENKFLDDREKKGKEILNGLEVQYKRLGLVAGVYKDLTKKTEEQLKKEELLKSVKEKSKDLLGDQGKKVLDLAAVWKDVAKTGNIYLIALKVMSDLIMLSIDRFIELQKAGEDFRKTTGLNVDQTKQLDKVALKLNQDYKQFGVSIKDAYDAAGDLMGELGNVRVLDNNKKLVETTVLLSKNLGVSSKEGAKFLTQTMSLSGVSSNVASSYASYAGNLAKAAGVPLNTLMKEVASASNETLAMVRGSTLELIKASASALRLGTNLNTLAKSARGMLNFQSSVTDEMEASVLVGKQLNFMESRRLAYAGDIEGAAKATLNTIKSAGDFQKMNVFQQEAVAKAAGISVGEINKMLMMEKQLAQLSSEERSEYEKLTKLSKEKVELTGQDLLKQAKMQSTLTNINNNFGKILQKLSDKLLPVVNILAKVIEFIVEGLANGGLEILLMFSPIMRVIELITNLWKRFSDLFKSEEFVNADLGKKILMGIQAALGALFDTFIKPFIEIQDWLKEKFMGKLLMTFLPILRVIGFLTNLWKRFSDLFKSEEFANADWGQKFLMGIQAALGALFDTFIEPFIEIWDWLKEKFMGNSPSELGLRIVEGIKSVGSMLFDVLTSPYKMLWDFVKELFPNMANFLVSSFKKGLDFIMKIPGVSWALEKVGVKMPTTNVVEPTKSEKENKVENTVDTNTQILSKLDELINLMKSGGIAVNIDGRRASELLAQASSY